MEDLEQLRVFIARQQAQLDQLQQQVQQQQVHQAQARQASPVGQDLSELRSIVTTLTRTRAHPPPVPVCACPFWGKCAKWIVVEVGSPALTELPRDQGRAADQRGRNPASAHKTLIQPSLRGGDFCKESQGGWEKKAEAALAKMATQRACVHVCHMPHALCDARHSQARVRVRCYVIHATLCALPTTLTRTRAHPPPVPVCACPFFLEMREVDSRQGR